MKMGLGPEARELDNQAIEHLTMIAFYYFLHVDQYTTKGTRTNSKQTKKFKIHSSKLTRRTILDLDASHVMLVMIKLQLPTEPP
jgi:hypothetical protein